MPKRVQELNLTKYALYDGPRTSEVQALFWEDVLDHERGIVRYRRAVVRGRVVRGRFKVPTKWSIGTAAPCVRRSYGWYS